jgi:uncharacterized protein (DUF2147 family)
MKHLVTLTLILFCSTFHGQSVLGKWQTIDDETGKKKSIVEIYEMNGKLYGKVIQLFRTPDQDQNPTCEKCDDDRKDQLVLGMDVIRDMTLQDGYYKSGTICDPNNGKVYRCEMWLSAGDPNKLELRGYWGFIYRTQTWIRL